MEDVEMMDEWMDEDPVEPQAEITELDQTVSLVPDADTEQSSSVDNSASVLPASSGESWCAWRNFISMKSLHLIPVTQGKISNYWSSALTSKICRFFVWYQGRWVQSWCA